MKKKNTPGIDPLDPDDSELTTIHFESFSHEEQKELLSILRDVGVDMMDGESYTIEIKDKYKVLEVKKLPPIS